MSFFKNRDFWCPDAQSWLVIGFAGLLCLLSFGVGYSLVGSSWIPIPPPEKIAEKKEKALRTLREKLEQPSTTLWKHIYGTNLRASLLLIFLGIMTAGISSGLFLLRTGFPLGISLGEFIHAELSLKLYFWSLVPHGVLEIPAFCFLSAIGLRMGIVFIRYLGGGLFLQPKEISQLVGMAFWGILLISLAGIVESWCTPYFALQYLN